MLHTRPGCLKRLLLVTGILLGLAVALAAVALVIRARFLRQGEELLDEVIAELDQAEPGWRWEDVLARRQVLKPEENSAPLVLAAAKLVPRSWPLKPAARGEGPPAADPQVPFARPREVPLPDRLLLWEPQQELSPPLAEEVWAEWDALQPALILARRLADGPPQGAYVVNWHPTNLLATVLPHVDAARNLGPLLHLDAVAQAHRGDGRAALAAVRALLHAARSFGDEPLLISHLVNLAQTHTALAAAERVLAQGTAPAADLETLQRLLELHREELPRHLRAHFRAERGAHHHLFASVAAGRIALGELAQEGSVAPGRWEEFRRWLYERPLAVHAGALGLREMGRALAVLDEAPEDQLAAADAWKAELDARRAAFTKQGDWRGLGLFMVLGLDRVLKQHFRACAQVDAAILGLAAERFRLARGRWPDRATDLVPVFLQALPMDPYASGKPFRWHRAADGLICYSVGPDREDNAGHIVRDVSGVKSVDGVAVGADVGFRLWDPERRRQPPPPPTPSDAQGPPD